jgi:CDP-diacylglycerol--glycerol-3-phosphate 3-phosphatidyltransferase
MLSASNSLSFIRAPLAFLFLQENSTLRIIAILLAMITDSIDGYLARKNQSVTRFGAILDPAMDKFFVYFAMTVLLLESKLAPWEFAAMLSRDFFLCVYGLLMVVTGQWKTVVFRAIKWGKVTTALQFLVLISLVLGFSLPWFISIAFILMGWLAFFELLQTRPSTNLSQ